jgi:4-amino-4-deoxy-L-arabinose transferase-like glycosyltransferase
MSKYGSIKLLKIKTEYLFLILILILSGLLRIWKISELPVFIDEALVGRVIFEMIYHRQITYMSGVSWQGPMIVYVLTPSIYFFGNKLLYLRLPIILFSTVTIFILYLFTRDFYSKNVALTTTFVLAIMPADIFLSKIAWEFSILSFFCIISLWLFQKYSRTRKFFYLYLFAFVIGLGIITRLSFIFFLCSFILTLKFNPFIPIKNIISNLNIKKISILTICFFMGIYPMLYNNFTENFPTIRYIFESVPVTKYNENLLDVKTNFFKGIYAFSEFLNIGYNVYCPKIIINYGIQLIFLLSIAIFLFFPKYKFDKEMNEKIYLKNLYLFINILIIFILVSTITITTFKMADYILLLPLSCIIIGWSINSILNLMKKRIFCSLLLILLIIYLSYVLYNDINFIPDCVENAEENPCNKFLNTTIYQLSDIPHSEILVDSYIYGEIFEYYLPKEKIDYLWYGTDTREDVEKRLETIIDSKNRIYVFVSDQCQPLRYKEINVYQIFSDTMVKQNKTLVLEKKVGENSYKIYRII